ncbi:hypothetical protein HC031_13295 [Planosporangium thailandense]|uniref:Uncharacterized protein n=1 Tax=Planosporangium thailandense TaxID=765197 RepID=A0ABX0XXB3_9ACTN|nr:hypothetical protein [Planosporangium thailandense]NJC70681.1 hypothetical protein [Planosporangium thailandense]
MRWLGLYLRSRGVPVALAVSVCVVAVVWGLFLGFSHHRDAGMRLVALAVMLAVVPVATTLAGPDDALERTASLPWPPRRAAHLLAALAVVTGLLLATQATAARFGPATVVLRDAAGLLGLTALGAAFLGAHRCWFAPVGWTLVVVPFLQPGGKAYEQGLAWMLQASGSRPATAVAVTLALVGAAAYTALGCPRRPASDPAAGS